MWERSYEVQAGWLADCETPNKHVSIHFYRQPVGMMSEQPTCRTKGNDSEFSHTCTNDRRWRRRRPGSHCSPRSVTVLARWWWWECLLKLNKFFCVMYCIFFFFSFCSLQWAQSLEVPQEERNFAQSQVRSRRCVLNNWIQTGRMCKINFNITFVLRLWILYFASHAKILVWF